MHVSIQKVSKMDPGAEGLKIAFLASVGVVTEKSSSEKPFRTLLELRCQD